MWFSLGLNNLIAKRSLNNDSCIIFVSDFVNIWHKNLTDEELHLISKKLNPLFEISSCRNKELILELFEEENAIKEFQEEEKNITLKFESKKMGFKFKFEITLHQGNKEMLYKEFTLPLLLTVIKLEEREKKLIGIIKEKDAEINEYKQEYGAFKSSYITTKCFSVKDFNNEEPFTPAIHNSSIFSRMVEGNIASSNLKPENPIVNECKTEIMEETTTSSKFNKTDTVFKDKNLRTIKNNKSCVNLDHQIVKKRRKHNDSFKIKF